MTEPGRTALTARLTFPRTEFDLIDLSRTFRYVDYVWADSVQALLAVAGLDYLPPRPRIGRPVISGLQLASPLWLELLITGGVTGGVSNAWWFFRYAVRNPDSIGSWWTDVKIGRQRAQSELAQLRSASAGREADPVDEALRLGAEVAASLPALAGLYQDGLPGLTGDESLATLREAAGLPASQPSDRPRQAVSEPAEHDHDSVIRRLQQDAQRLVDIAGQPEIEES